MIRIVIPDSGPLISLSMADALDLLIKFNPGVKVVFDGYCLPQSRHHTDVFCSHPWRSPCGPQKGLN